MTTVASDLTFLAAHSVTHQTIFSDEEEGGSGTYADFEAALPLPWSTDKPRTREQIATLRKLHGDPELADDAIFRVLHRPLFASLDGCGFEEATALLQLAEWLQLPVALVRRLELHLDALRLRAVPPTDTSVSGLVASLPPRLHALWEAARKQLRDVFMWPYCLQEPKTYADIADLHAGLLGIALLVPTQWCTWGRMAG